MMNKCPVSARAKDIQQPLTSICCIFTGCVQAIGDSQGAMATTNLGYDPEFMSNTHRESFFLV